MQVSPHLTLIHFIGKAAVHHPIFHVSYPPNPGFIGRTEILTAIHHHLVVDANRGFTATFALHGLGGVGKTQIAIRFAYDHQHDFDIIYWLRANNWNTLISSYLEMSRDRDLFKLGTPKFENVNDAVAIAQELKGWFERQHSLRWLLIFDNVLEINDEEETRKIVNMIPRGQYGCVLMTSRNPAIANTDCEVTEMSKNEATHLLLECSQRKGSGSDEQVAVTLVQMLGYLPLAIEQAGGFIRTTGISFGQYIILYEENKSELLQEELPISQQVYYQNTVATTWKISFDQIDKQDPLASEILRVIIFLDGSKIQKDLFTAGREVLTDNWRLSKATLLDIERSLRCLQAYSLIRPLTENNIAIHPLVQQVMLGDIGKDASLYFDVTLKLVRYQFPWGFDLDNMNTCLNYLAQAESCSTYGLKFKNNSSEMTWLLDSLGTFFDRNGQYNEAVMRHESSLRINEKAFGVDHINTADTINNLGSTYSRQGKYDEAIAHYERSLRIFEKAFGVDHINTADTINNLGSTYDSQGKYDEAIAHYERSLRIFEKAFGVDHINTADTINNLGSTYDSQGKYDEAIAHYERSLRIFEKAFGVDHINTADTINNLGSTYDSQGKYDEAIAHYERSLRIFEKAFGVDHIHTASPIMNIGLHHQSQGRVQLAKVWLQRGHKILLTNLGAEHPYTLQADSVILKTEIKLKTGRSKHQSSFKSRLKRFFS